MLLSSPSSLATPDRSHRATATTSWGDALITLCHAFPAVRWFMYEDIPYSRRADLVQARLESLARRGISAESFPSEEDLPSLCRNGERKAAAVLAYRSQLLGLGHADEQRIMQHPERYWRIHRNVGFL